MESIDSGGLKIFLIVISCVRWIAAVGMAVCLGYIGMGDINTGVRRGVYAFIALILSFILPDVVKDFLGSK